MNANVTQIDEIREMLAELLWTDPGERDDEEWNRLWYALGDEWVPNLDGINIVTFCNIWPIRELGENEEYLWRETDNLKRLKDLNPEMARLLLTEETGAYLLVRGLNRIGIELYRKRLFTGKNGRERLLRDDESEETAGILREEREKLVKELKALGFSYKRENLLWDYLKLQHPSCDNAAFFFAQLGRLWKMLGGNAFHADLTESYVCRYIESLAQEGSYEGEWENCIMYAFGELGKFGNIEGQHKGMQLRHFCDNLLSNKSEKVLALLLRLGFFSKKELNRLQELAAERWEQAVPMLVMAVHGMGEDG